MALMLPHLCGKQFAIFVSNFIYSIYLVYNVRIHSHFIRSYSWSERKLGNHTRNTIHLCSKMRHVCRMQNILRSKFKNYFSVNRKMEFLSNYKIIHTVWIRRIYTYEIFTIKIIKKSNISVS